MDTNTIFNVVGPVRCKCLDGLKDTYPLLQGIIFGVEFIQRRESIFIIRNIPLIEGEDKLFADCRIFQFPLTKEDPIFIDGCVNFLHFKTGYFDQLDINWYFLCR
ncbi:hypothetical protein SDC9_153297 [bioreactor metagenome]|uniref:Uncharacterized protein n=1 Tax=bioreactor metagenome TaxID=1076179 RepID=A0A645F060_9ZZZZ